MLIAPCTPHKAQKPRNIYVCPACEGTGYDWAYGNNPSEKPFRVTCTLCNGQGALERAAA